MHLSRSGDGDSFRSKGRAGERALYGAQARRSNNTDLAPLEARYASAKANVREVMQRMQQLNRQYHQVLLHVPAANAMLPARPAFMPRAWRCDMPLRNMACYCAGAWFTYAAGCRHSASSRSNLTICAPPMMVLGRHLQQSVQHNMSRYFHPCIVSAACPASGAPCMHDSDARSYMYIQLVSKCWNWVHLEFSKHGRM